MRLNVVPLVVPTLFRFAATRRFMFRTISQTAVNYRGSSLSEGRAGTVHGGDRLPWVTADSNGVRQLHAADVARLAGPRVRRRRARDPGGVRGADIAAARLSLASGDGSGRPALWSVSTETASVVQSSMESLGEPHGQRSFPASPQPASAVIGARLIGEQSMSSYLLSRNTASSFDR